MKRIAVLGLMAVVGVANAALWDQSQLINMPNAGTGAIAGQHLSMLETGENIFGFGVQGPANNIMADDFTMSTSGTITGFSVFSYITNATAPGVTSVNYAIGATASTSLTNVVVASTFWSVGGQGVYRVNVGDTAGSARRIQVTTVSGLNIPVSAGTYFLSFNVNPGNFSPPLPSSLATHGKNAVQSTGGGAFNQVFVDAGLTVGADMAFIIEGTAVPEPATLAVLGLGALALIRRRKR